jgi:tRNA(Ile)-lysidine synthase
VLSIAELVTDWHGQKELTLPGIRVGRTGGAIHLKSSKTLTPGAC